jgi:hypothetical protein
VTVVRIAPTLPRHHPGVSTRGLWRHGLAGVIGLGLLVAGCRGETNPGPQTATIQPAAAGVATAAARATTITPGPVQIVDIQIRPNDATIFMRSFNDSTVYDIGGWRIQAGTTAVTLLEDFTRLAPHETLAVFTGSAAPTSASPVPTTEPTGRLYLGPTGSALRAELTSGTSVRLINDSGLVVSEYVIP